MSTGKYTSLEEARKKGDLKRFIKEHPSEANKKDFEGLLDAMTKKPKADEKT